MSEEIKEDQDCCEVWPKIAIRFNWMRYENYPEMASMPHISDGENKWFVNYCPSCGKPARNRNMLIARIF
jgi:hypothetical protein